MNIFVYMVLYLVTYVLLIGTGFLGIYLAFEFMDWLKYRHIKPEKKGSRS